MNNQNLSEEGNVIFTGITHQKIMETEDPTTIISLLTTEDDNNSTEIYSELSNLEMYAILVPTIWGILTVIGGLGNALVIYTLVRHGDKNATNYFVINLAISDFAFVVFVAPFTATLYALPHWIFGNGMCKMTMYIIYVTLHATCLTLMAMTIDRYCAIVHAVQSRNWRTTTASFIVCLVVWLVSCIVSLPFAIFFRTVPSDRHGDPVGAEHCYEVWPEPKQVYVKASIIIVVFTTYVVPLAVILFCYARILKILWNKRASSGSQSNGISSKKTQQQDKRRKRVTKLVASVVIVFATFWLPIHIVNLWIKLDENFPKTAAMYNFKIFAHTLSYANSCVNPFVYAFLSDGFRKAFQKTFPGFAQRYRICGGPNDECVSNAMAERFTEHTKATMTEERRLMQTDL